MGRPAINDSGAMTPAERQRRRRGKLKAQHEAEQATRYDEQLQIINRGDVPGTTPLPRSAADRIAQQIEDYLEAVPEVRIGDVLAAIKRRFPTAKASWQRRPQAAVPEPEQIARAPGSNLSDARFVALPEISVFLHAAAFEFLIRAGVVSQVTVLGMLNATLGGIEKGMHEATPGTNHMDMLRGGQALLKEIKFTIENPPPARLHPDPAEAVPANPERNPSAAGTGELTGRGTDE